MEFENKVLFAYNSLDEAFPACDPNYLPFGSRVCVQMRKPKKQTASGLYIPEDTKDTELWNTQVAKVISVGPLAFRNRTTMALWPENVWAEPGAYVRVPKYGGDRWTVKDSDGEAIMFVAFNDLDLGGLVPDPLNLRAFI